MFDLPQTHPPYSVTSVCSVRDNMHLCHKAMERLPLTRSFQSLEHTLRPFDKLMAGTLRAGSQITEKDYTWGKSGSCKGVIIHNRVAVPRQVRDRVKWCVNAVTSIPRYLETSIHEPVPYGRTLPRCLVFLTEKTARRGVLKGRKPLFSPRGVLLPRKRVLVSKCSTGPLTICRERWEEAWRP